MRFLRFIINGRKENVLVYSQYEKGNYQSLTFIFCQYVYELYKKKAIQRINKKGLILTTNWIARNEKLTSTNYIFCTLFKPYNAIFSNFI
ncbi:hypothetical protein THALO_30227 [Tenacibaculum halocynthiae]